MEIKVATTNDDVARLIILRYKVFVLEQGFAEDLEVDEHDAVATFLVAKERQRVVGTLRLFKNKENVSLGRMAVAKDWRKKGVGLALVAAAIPIASKIGGLQLIAHAQVQALGFYIKAGLTPRGMVFDEEGVPHQLVCRDLNGLTKRTSDALR